MKQSFHSSAIFREPLIVPVTGFSLSLAENHDPKNGKKGAYGTLRISEFVEIGKISIQSDPGAIANWFNLNWCDATMDFPHYQGLAHESLEDQCSSALWRICTMEHPDAVRSFVEGKSNTPVSFDFRPDDWQGMNLHVPIAFVRLSSIDAREKGGPVTGYVQLGDHLRAKSVKLYSGTESDEIMSQFDGILSESCTDLISKFLRIVPLSEILAERSRSGFQVMSEGDEIYLRPPVMPVMLG